MTLRAWASVLPWPPLPNWVHSPGCGATALPSESMVMQDSLPLKFCSAGVSAAAVGRFARASAETLTTAVAA